MVATKRILVVDDEDIVCRSYERVLMNAGFEVEKAHDGKAALDNIGKREYDVMLADLRMPGMDGLQVVRKLRETHPKMPVIVVTGYPSRETLLEAARLGVTDYLTKPVAPDVLTEATTLAMTGPTWSTTPAYLQSATVPAPATVVPPIAAKPVVPDAMPAAPVTPPIAVPAMPRAPAAQPAPRRHGVFGSTLRLCGGLAMSLAYVLFLPLAGFAVLLGLGGKALVQKMIAKRA
ncbi:MAG: response regulator [Planctomycetes bacterium]|nr:response regulator [Planctomycetota bacterium]